MLREARAIAEGSQVEADLCLIGAGAAGITIARELATTGVRVCLLESGGFEAEEATQRLYRGTIEPGFFSAKSKYLSESRLRYFGGTTNHWQGWCHPLDEHDFIQRSWIPRSGWPISRADLDPFYDRAAPICEIAPFPKQVDELARSVGPALKGLAQAGFTQRIFHFSPRTRFGSVYRQALIDAENIDLILHANVTRIAARKDGRSIRHVDVATLEGRTFRVAAKAFVLATGGIENPRMLLNSDDVHQNGLGNQHDQVGRYFMEHTMKSRATDIVLSQPPSRMDLYERKVHAAFGHDVRAYFVLPLELQRKHRLANVAFSFRSFRKKDRTKLGLSVLKASATLDRDATATQGTPPLRRQLRFMTELIPAPENRITLLREKDALGLRRVHFRWQQTAADIDSINRSIKLMGERLGMVKIGRIRPLPRKRYSKSFHHIGTTRMHADAKQGVVDANCRVHGVDNLYIAGSSVFPTSGFANPTLTIVALALRLTDHLKSKLATAPAGLE